MYVVVALGRVVVVLGGRAGEKLPDVARIHTRPIKLKYFSILSLNQTIKQSNNQTIRMAYYKQAGYMTEAEMKKQGKNETEKAKQRGLNFTIRLEHYAKSNSLQFRKMVEEWAEERNFDCENPPADESAMTMLHMLKLARENGILSGTIGEFSRAELTLKERFPHFISPAAVPFNQEQRNKNCLAALKARVAKREKKQAAVLARNAGKAAAAEKRAADKAAWDLAVRKGREEIEQKTAAARKAMGVRKNEANPASIRQMIERWEMDMAVALYAARMNA
ncbi:MAG: hypothetical protein EBU46_15640 [Nitrosomonadaceae bacterium]|nr:hypothetical protein [Nitrosomonadaceae bacterium]